ncbi:MAG: cysteine desulfurase [Chlorobiaceae bacterium]
MPEAYQHPNITGAESESLNPTYIAQLASRLFNEVPEAGNVPRSEGDASEAPSAVTTAFHDKTAFIGARDTVDFSSSAATSPTLHDFYFLPQAQEKEPEPLEHHANKLTEQQNYSESGKGSNGLDQLLRRSLPAQSDGNECFAEKLYREFSEQQGSPVMDVVFQALRGGAESSARQGVDRSSFTQPEFPGKSPAPVWPNSSPETPGSAALPFAPAEPYYFLREPQQPIHQAEGFDVTTIRKDFPVLHQKIHGKPLAWFDNAATTQKPLSVINAVAQFYATDNSNIHRGAHTLAARATDAYEGAREKIRQFIGAGSTSEIIYVRGTTEGINLVAQTWGRKFLQPGDEIILSILEHHANIVPWQMVAQEKGARIRVVPVNERGEIMLEEYTKLLGPRTRLVSLTQASNGLGTILPIKEMIQLAKRYDARVLVDGAQSVAHIPVNVQDLDADFFVFSGHKIFAPTGIGVVYGKKELLEVMPPWQGGGNMIKDVRFEETIYNEAPAKFEAGTPSIGDAIGLGAALDYVRKIGLENIAQYEHELTEYGTEKLIRIPGLRLIGTARNKVGVLSFVLNNLPNDEVGKLLDREGIAVRAGHHCTQPSLRRFGVEGTVRPSLAFYNTKDEIDRLADVINHIQRR